MSENIERIERVLRFALKDPKRARDTLPMVCVDECMNHPMVYQTIRNSASKGNARVPPRQLWQEKREKNDGSPLWTIGSVSRNMRNLLPIDWGDRAQGVSWGDPGVILLLVGWFNQFTTLLLLTGDINTRNQLGLQQLLRDHVKPFLDANHGDTFSLRVLCKKGNTTVAQYCQHVEALLEKRNFRFGFSQAYV